MPAAAPLPRLVALVGACLLAGAGARPAPAAQGSEAPSAPIRGLQAERSGRADYRIRARLDEAEDGRWTLAGALSLDYRHAGPEPTRELWLHLYHNAFANNRSVHQAQEGGRGGRGGRRAEPSFGWQRILAARAQDEDLLASLRYRTPEGFEEDRTVFSLELPRALRAGETLTLELEWESLVPGLRRRTGHKGDFFLMAHWIPKLGVFEPGRGWVCHPFYPSTEFYADFGAYDVTLDLPERYAGAFQDAKVGASGVWVGPGQKSDGRFVLRFLAPSEADRAAPDATGKHPLVHGFAWAADPRFVVSGGTFRARDWAARFPEEVEKARAALGPEHDRGLRDVEVVVLLQPEHASQAERHFEATCAALFFYGLWYGGYPYERVTVVDPAWGARAAGGMEYPTLFTAGTRLFTTPSMHSPEGVTIHECGHQFWYGLVGNNEFEAAWLDEGLNSYTDSEVLWRVYGLQQRTTDYARVPFHGVAPAARPGEGAGPLAALLAGRSLTLLGRELAPVRASGFLEWWRDQPLLSFTRRKDDPREHDRVRYLDAPDVDPIDKPAFEYLDGSSYRANSYSRPAVALRTLKGLVGEEAFLRGMRLFSERWRYGHPYPEDFFEAFLEGSGADVRWYLEEAFRGTATADWSVAVQQRARAAPKGYFQESPAAPFEERKRAAREKGARAQADEAPAEADEEGTTGDLAEEARAEEARAEEAGDPAAKDAREWELELVLRRKGTLCLPIEVELRYADGTRRRETWTREAQLASSWWRPLGRAWARSEVKLEAVVLDPDQRIWLDLDRSNDRWFEAHDSVLPWRQAERTWTQYAHTLFWYAGLGG